MVNPVVNRVAPAPFRMGEMPVGGFAHTRRDKHLGVGVSRLTQVDRHPAFFQLWQMDRNIVLPGGGRGIERGSLVHGDTSI